jgi:hypothetical protein
VVGEAFCVVKDLLGPNATLFTDPHARELPVENEHFIIPAEGHIVLYDNTLIPKCAAGVREKEPCFAERVEVILPDG